MITIPMSVATYDDTLPMDVTSSEETIDMLIGAEYAIAGAEVYTGEYEVIPKAHESQTLETKDKLMEDNVFIFSVPYFQTSNEHGDTVYIASEV